MYPEELVKPMREELTNAGFEALYTSKDVDNAMSKKGTTLVMVNSVCGCAAGTARPGAIAPLAAEKTPTNLTTVFAGVEKESIDGSINGLINKLFDPSIDGSTTRNEGHPRQGPAPPAALIQCC